MTLASQPIIAVSGLPRSGTSLLMQSLHAAGVPVLTDGQRVPDVNNPRGYWEYTPVMHLGRDQQWLPEARGKAVKIILHLLPMIPVGTPLQVLCMRRPIEEVVASQAAMLRELGHSTSSPAEKLSETMENQGQKLAEQITCRPEVAWLDVPFLSLVAGDPALAQCIIDFLNLPGLDPTALCAAADPTLYRKRASHTPTK